MESSTKPEVQSQKRRQVDRRGIRPQKDQTRKLRGGNSLNRHPRDLHPQGACTPERRFTQRGHPH